MTRAETITTLLEHLTDYETTLIRTGNPGDHHPPAMPAMYHHPSVRELYRTLDRLYYADRTACAHLKAFYRSEWRTISTRRRIRDKKGRLKHLDGPRQRQRIVNPWILIEIRNGKIVQHSNAPVNRGLKWTIQNFQGEPFLPDELRTELVA